MGIRGLTTFLDINSQLLTDFKLRDIHVLIDGNNLFHFLYNLYSLRDDCGGDYDGFATAARSFFATLRQCNVEGIVIFDGPYNPKEKKMLISIKRARERINVAHELSLGRKGKATPILCQDVFVSVLEAGGVRHATAEGEADPELAALSNKYGWPVMTNDSDFFIYNLKSGVILLDYVNLQIKTDSDVADTTNVSSKYISVQLYYFSRLYEQFTMETDLIALFGTIFGNDRVQIQTFDEFFAKIRVKSGSSKLFTGRKQAKMLGIFQWLEAAGTLHNAIERILSCYKLDRREDLRKIIMDSVNSYKIVKEPCPHLVEVCDGIEDGPMISGLRTLAGHPLPDWFLSELYRSKVSVVTVNAAISRKLILLPQPENFSLGSAHDCARSLRRVIYGVTLRYDKEYHNTDADTTACSDTCSANSQKNMYVEEIDRDLKKQKRSLADPIMTLGSLTVPSLREVVSLDQGARMELLCAAFGVEAVVAESFPRGLELHLLCIVCWANHSQPKADLLHLYTIIICLIKLYALDPIKTSEEPTQVKESSGDFQPISSENLLTTLKSEDLSKVILDNCPTEILLSVKEALERFLKLPRAKNQAILADTNTLHIFAQFQSCVMAGQALNQVLGSPVGKIPVSRVLSGTFLFNFYRDVKSRKNPEAFIQEFLDLGPIVAVVTKAMKDIVMGQISPGSLICDLEHQAKRSSKKRVTKVKDKVDETESDQTTVRQNGEEKKMKILAKCKIVNRFDCLMLDE